MLFWISGFFLGGAFGFKVLHVCIVVAVEIHKKCARMLSVCV